MQIAQQQHPRKDEDPGISLKIGSFFATKIKVGIFFSNVTFLICSGFQNSEAFKTDKIALFRTLFLPKLISRKI